MPAFRFDKGIRTLRGELKLAIARKLDLKEKIEEEIEKLADIENPHIYR